MAAGVSRKLSFVKFCPVWAIYLTFLCLFKCNGKVYRRFFMYSDELTKYLYSYGMPQEPAEALEKEAKTAKENEPKKAESPLLHVLRSAYATVPIKFSNE